MTAKQTIGKYEVLEQIGAGGFASVFKARDPFIKRLVAIKLCNEPDDTLRRRFFREAEISGNLHHPSIVTVFDCGLEDDAPYLVQEYLRGNDLDKLIRRGEPIPMEERLQCLVQVAKALRYAHSKGVMHRDVKPGNIRYLGGGKAKLMDFGIATLKSGHTRLTRVGTVVGTAGYLAPEQLRGEDPDERVDIFSYGVLTYELLTLRQPFRGDSFEQVCRNILSAEPEPFTDDDDFPAELAPVVERCLSKYPDERYPSFAEILPELGQALVRLRPDRRQTEAASRRPPGATRGAAAAATGAAPGSASSTAPRASLPVPGRRWLRTAALAALALAAVAAVWLARRPGGPPPGTPAAGLLVVDAAPWGELVEISDLAGNPVPLPQPPYTPLTLRLASGGYQVVVADPGGERRGCEVELAAGASERCVVRFGQLTADDYFQRTGWWR